MFRIISALALAGVLVSTPAMAAGRNDLYVLTETERAVEGGRDISVLVPQAELGANINPSYVAIAMGGGLIGALIDTSVQAHRAENAGELITPVRASLLDFDADALAVETTNTMLANMPWLDAHPASFGRDTSLHTKTALLTASTAPQVAFFEYVYDVSSDFSAVRVGVTITIANTALPTGSRQPDPEDRLNRRNLVYTQTLTSVVQLPNAGAAPANAARWGANDAALTRRALALAFADMATLTPRALAMTDADIETASAGARRTIGQYTGRVMEDGPSGVLLYNRGLTHVQTLSE